MDNQVTDILRKTIKPELDKSLDYIRSLEPKELTAKLAKETEELFNNSKDFPDFISLVNKVKAGMELLTIAQTYVGEREISQTLKDEYRRLVILFVTKMDPLANLEYLETDIEVTFVTCPSDLDMQAAINHIKEKMKEEGVGYLIKKQTAN